MTCLACLIGLLAGCKLKQGEEDMQPSLPSGKVRFTLLSPAQTNVHFSNVLAEDSLYNIYTYEYLYNGNGIATGDVNGDGLPDLYFSSAFGSNRLYLNKGNMVFVDLTDAADVAAPEGYKTGVTMADVNGDGLLDIYSCRTNKFNDGKKSDHLFINLGNRKIHGLDVPRFRDQASAYGLNDNSNTNHANFFDFDRDGDLDLFLLNHRVDFRDATKLVMQQNPDGTLSRVVSVNTPYASNRLYLNSGNHFTDITQKAGLMSSAFGLSATTADLNADGWMDIYIANDYIEPDNIYINNRDGTFTDRYVEYLRHSSQNSMGCDIADINNDGLVDIMVLDMKAEDHVRYKELANVMQHDRYAMLVQYGYGRQAGRNVLQLNVGNNSFVEIGQYAGVSATDWSWAPLIADFNNDGWRDLYITNGYRKDVTNLDYMNYYRDSVEQSGTFNSLGPTEINEILKHIPHKKVSNYLYLNTSRLSFTDAGKQAGLDHPSFSNGAAYADLDRDGDLDLVVNNLDEPAFIYRNDSEAASWLQIDVRLPSGNTAGIGTSVDVYSTAGQQYAMVSPSRGFLSASEPVLHFGLGSATKIDSIRLCWPDGSFEYMKDVRINQRLLWKKGTGSVYRANALEKKQSLFNTLTNPGPWKHRENEFNDFKREKGIPYMLSAEGPCLAVGDINGDHLDDIYAGNASGYPSGLLIQRQDGTFSSVHIPALLQDTMYEDCAAVMEDFNLDGDMDLLVASGGNAFPLNAPEYMARLYLNKGNGVLQRDVAFPVIRTNAGAILAVDFDGDMDKDVIIAGRCVPGAFPKSPRSYFLKNEGGRFRDATAEFFPELENLGMITDLKSADINGDGKPEVVIAGEWMPISVFSYTGHKMINTTSAFGFEKTAGLWKRVILDDIDGDGDLDILAGNIGLNHRLHASGSFPLTLIASDFDQNGSIDPVMCYYDQERLYPYAGRDALISQIPALKKKFLRYGQYATATVEDIFSGAQLKGSDYWFVHTFQTMLFRNTGHTFTPEALPYQAQLSPVYGIVIRDFNLDGRKDILMAGNFSYAETETGEMDAGIGTLMQQTSDGDFEYVPNREHGFWARGEVREMCLVHLASGHEAILTGNNRGLLEMTLMTHKPEANK